MIVVALLAGLAVALTIYHFGQDAWKSWQLRHIPGPFWAALSNIPRARWVLTGRAHEIHDQLHQKYGRLVRIGPHAVSVNDPDAIPIIYPTKTGLVKGDFYNIFQPYGGNEGSIPDIFPAHDEKFHSSLKKPVAPLYSVSGAAAMEDTMDDILEVFFSALDERFTDSGLDFEFSFWLEAYAYDLMATLTFSKRYGFLDSGYDVNGIKGNVWAFMSKAAPLTQMPWLDRILNKNKIAAFLHPTTSNPMLHFVAQQIEERSQAKDVEDASGAEDDEKQSSPERTDMLSHFLDMSKNPSLPPLTMTGWTFSNVVAGSDSVASVLTGAWYDLLSNPSSYKRLQDELFAIQGLNMPFPSWHQIKDLPYLEACTWESIRMHPAFALPLERTVPAGGLTVSDQYLPPGTKVGMNPYVANRNVQAFGEDADVWRAERWLDLDADHQRKLHNNVISFGAGRRVCMGKNIAVMEIKKVVAALTVNYEIDLARGADWKVQGQWLLTNKGLQAQIRRRQNVQD